MKVQAHHFSKKSMFKTVVAIFVFIAFTGCSSNPISCLNGSWIEEVSTDLEKWTAATNAYSEEPTEENCANYKSALNGYLNALDDVEDCVPATSLSDFEVSLDEAKLELSEIDCSEN